MYFEISAVCDIRSSNLNKNWKSDKSMFLDIRGYIEISVFEISRVDYFDMQDTCGNSYPCLR